MVTSFSKYFLFSLVTKPNDSSSNAQMITNNDQIIIDQIINGDTQVFAVLVDRYKNLVFTLAIRMLKNREEAEEVSQDTFIKVYKSLKKFKGDSKFSTWLYRVAYNTCLDRLKSSKRKRHTIEINEFTERQVRTLDDALSKLEAQEQNQTIQNCLQLLPPDDAALLTLYYYDELSLEEIAKVVNLTANNVKVKLFRSRKKLTAILKVKLDPEIIKIYESSGQ